MCSAKFETFDSLQQFISNKEEKDYIQLWVSSSRTIEGARKKGVKRAINENLKYYEISYRCIHGGNRMSRSTGKRPRQSTFRQDCPFILRLKASADGNTLDIQYFKDEHNHAHTQETYAFLPRQRQLDPATREMAKHMLDLRVNKKLLQAELLQDRKITLKDIHNIASKNSVDDSLETTVKYLLTKDTATVELVKNENNILQGLYYQDEEMKRLYQCYPEILFVDSIYKVSNLRAGLYVFAVEDGNGESEIVGFFLALSEDSETMHKMVEIFKKYNQTWEKTICIMTDKDFQERNAFRNGFPKASLLLCLFHTLRTFRREVTTEKMGIRSSERHLCLELLQRMAYSKTETEYENIRNEIKDTKLKPFIDYVEKNWHPIKNEWVISFHKTTSLQNRTNNRLEALNSKIMQVVQRHSKLPDLFKNLDILLLSLRTERDNKAIKAQMKIPYHTLTDSEEEKKYLEFLTPYAYRHVAERLKLKNKVKIIREENEFAVVSSSSGFINVYPDKCSCYFFTTMNLPCHHILKIREIKNLPLYSENLVSTRWTKSFYINNSIISSTAVTMEHEVPSLSVTTTESKKIYSQHEKFRIAANKANKLASLASEVSSRLFPQRLKVLEDIIKMWEDDMEVAVIPLSNIAPSYTEDINLSKIEKTVPISVYDPENNETDANFTSEHDTIELDMPIVNNTVLNTEDINLGIIEETASISVYDPENNETDANSTSEHDDTIKLDMPIVNNTVLNTEDINLGMIEATAPISVYDPENNETDANSTSEHDTIELDIPIVNTTVLNHPNFSNFSSEVSQSCIKETMSMEFISLEHSYAVSAANNNECSLTSTTEPIPQQVTSNAIIFNIHSASNESIPSSQEIQSGEILQDLPQLPSKMKKRGRPKGCDKTVIGLPKKKLRINKVSPFETKSMKEKERIMLGWFLLDEDVEDALNGSIIDEHSVKQNPNNVSSACLEEMILIDNIRKYFTAEAWVAVRHIISVKQQNQIWFCPICETECTENSVCCKSCLNRHHLRCASLKALPKRKWFCRACFDKNIS